MLAAGVLLVLAIVVFLALDRWKNPFNRRDLPTRLGIEIQQEANGVIITQAHDGHTLFRIHASKVVQLKQGMATLHDVQIDLYGQDGKSVDRIVGDEFEYDQKTGIATAAGPVQITLMQPSVAPAIAPKATPERAINKKNLAAPLAGMAGTAASGEILVKTSGLTFDQKNSIVSTSQHVDFSSIQGSGSSMGATYDSQMGRLVLVSAVELTAQRGGQPVQVHAAHAEFESGDRICHLLTATADYRGGEATAAQATIRFREDGSAIQMDASGGFTATTSTGGHLAAPSGSLDFDQHNQPQYGHLAGGVQMDSVSPDRQVHGTAQTAEIAFTASGELKHAHLEREVEMRSETTSQAAGSRGGPTHLTRTWRSPVADIYFRDAGHGQVEPVAIQGTGGVVVTSMSHSGKEPTVPSRMTANAVAGIFGPNSTLTAMTGMGNAKLEETSLSGTQQTATGDRIEAHFAPGDAKGAKDAESAAAELESAVLDGHVVLIQQPPAGAKSQAPMRATAGRATYEGAGEWVHLTLSPRVEDGSLQITANRIDLSRTSGDAFAHGDVKASWTDTSAQPNRSGSRAAGPALGGQGPAHAIASEAVLHQTSGEATFAGHARLWQQANSVAGPVIVLDRQRQTLAAHTSNPADPVRVVLLSAAQPSSPDHPAAQASGLAGNGKSSEPAVIRVRGGNLLYSDAEHKAVIQGGVLSSVTAATETATSVSRQIELDLVPPAQRNHAEGKAESKAAGQVERMIATGGVILSSGDRRGTGERLEYTGATGEYVLTGTAAAPPRMTDPARGTVTGAALIFRSRDDSVSIEGGGHKTTTNTTAPK